MFLSVILQEYIDGNQHLRRVISSQDQYHTNNFVKTKNSSDSIMYSNMSITSQDS